MAIPAAAKPTPLDAVNANNEVIYAASGRYTESEVLRQQKLRNYIVGMGRLIPCSCSTTTNVITLTPNGHGAEDGLAPNIEGYRFGDMFLFVADVSTTGSVTGTVVPKTGSLATLKFYITGGAAQAGNGDITAGRVYIGVYVYSLDTNAGGIVVRHP